VKFILRVSTRNHNAEKIFYFSTDNSVIFVDMSQVVPRIHIA